jgi:hypothetical protein
MTESTETPIYDALPKPYQTMVDEMDLGEAELIQLLGGALNAQYAQYDPS